MWGGLSCRVSHGSAFVVHFCRVQSVRTKEEKEVLEHFAGVVSLPFSTLIKHGCMWECCKLLKLEKNKEQFKQVSK